MSDEVKVAYDQAKKDVSNLIGFLGNEMEKEPDDLNWGHVGDLNRIKDTLLELLTSMTGFDKDEIVNSLQEL